MAQTSNEVASLSELHQHNRNEAIARATKPLDDSYVSNLERIKKRLTTAGRLEEAVQIESILDGIELQKKLPGEWQWGEKRDRILAITVDQTATLSGDEEKAAWIALGPRKIRLFFVHTSYTVTFDDKMTTGTAERRDGVKAVIRRVE
jgi:hypothetical protein